MHLCSWKSSKNFPERSTTTIHRWTTPIAGRCDKSCFELRQSRDHGASNNAGDKDSSRSRYLSLEFSITMLLLHRVSGQSSFSRSAIREGTVRDESNVSIAA